MSEASTTTSTGSTGRMYPAYFVNHSLVDFLKYLLKKWWLFLIVGVLAGLAGIYYASLQKAVYKSRLTFALDDAGEGGMSGALNLAAQFGLSVGNSSNVFSGDNIIEILRSRQMVEGVLLSVDTFNNKPYTLVNYFLEKQYKPDAKTAPVSFPVGQPKADFTYQQDSVLYNIYLHFITNNITAQKPDRKLSIYEVNVTTSDEKLTKVFTERLVSQTNDFYVDICSKKAKKTLDVLENRVAFMKGNLNTSISGRAASQDANVNPAFAAANVPLQKQQANIQVYSGAYAELFKNLEMARFQYLNKIPLMQIIDPADYPMKKIKRSKLKTGMIFAIASGLLLLFIFWMRRLANKMPAQPIVAV